ncbi:anthranilate phosphoribosyltransferase [Acidithiobacillus sp.]|uniref:anthranilate phosphoribosyltransferase n=1 Tax=Acidithiobacillus sp. TaxID=1872118 RepID=UPI0026346512|nr:anthranilate phosphoribosyltransferase [Acidithiobacillus sp.]MDD5280376.1 anthranilate phosphoribosyltransferase [Acidithiobacillus sp.]
MMVRDILEQIAAGQDLSREQAQHVFAGIMAGDWTPAQIGALLMGLRMKGQRVEELVGATLALRACMTRVEVSTDHLLDTCGTGGDALSTFNISTVSAVVAAAGGARVAKHGNRSMVSRSGSADVLEAAGLPMDMSPEAVAQSIEKIGIGFLFAPAHHGAMRHAVGPRKELAIRSLFNLMGPLSNPAGAPHQVLGVYAERWLIPLAEAARELGSRHVLVVHGHDGLDEISLSAPTDMAELKDGVISRNRIQPEDFGIARAPLASLQISSVAEALSAAEEVLQNRAGPRLDVVLLNAGAALYAADVVPDMAVGVVLARDILKSGAAWSKWQELLGKNQ